MQRVLVTCVTLSLFATLAGKAPADYVYTTIDVPGVTFTQVYGINDAGQIVGDYFGSNGRLQAFLLSNGTLTRLQPTDSITAQAIGINNLGQIVGSYGDTMGQSHGFVLSGGTYTTLDVPPSFAGPNSIAKDTTASGINTAGQIVGYFTVATGLRLNERAFVLDGGVYRDITEATAAGARANGINNAGQIVGTGGGPYGFLLANGQYTDFLVPGSNQTIGEGINDTGQIVGAYATPSNIDRDYGFVLSDGVYTTLDFPGAIETDAYGINNAGDIVGIYQDGGHRFHGFVARPAPIPEPRMLLLLSVAGCFLLACMLRRGLA